MNSKIRLALGLALLPMALMLLVGLAFWRQPLTIMESLTRWGLERRLDLGSEGTPRGELSYFHGGGEGELIVLLHGLGDQAGSWGGVVSGLGENYRYLIPDLPGHGDSEPLVGPLTPRALEEGTARLLETQGEPGMVLIGHSLGGWVALRAAMHSTQRLSRPSRLILIAPAGMSADLDLEGLIPHNRDEAKQLARRLGGASAPIPPGFFLDDVVDQAATGPLPRLLGVDLDRWRLDEEELRNLDLPVDVIWGEEDGLLPLAQGEELVALLPQGRLHRLPSCGHLPQQTCLPELVRRISDILASSPLPAAGAADAADAGPS